MKRFRILITYSFYIFSLSAMYLLGRFGGQQQVMVVYRDAPRAVVTKEKSLGTVAAAVSRVSSPSPETRMKLPAILPSSEMFITDDLWREVNAYRGRHELPSFTKDSVLCDLVGTRLEELKNKGALDDHAGFRSRTDFYLGEKGYHKLAENTAQGYESIPETIAGWDGSLAHQTVMRAVDMEKGCAGRESGFAVLIIGRK